MSLLAGTNCIYWILALFLVVVKVQLMIQVANGSSRHPASHAKKASNTLKINCGLSKASILAPLARHQLSTYFLCALVISFPLTQMSLRTRRQKRETLSLLRSCLSVVDRNPPSSRLEAMPCMPCVVFMEPPWQWFDVWQWREGGVFS